MIRRWLNWGHGDAALPIAERRIACQWQAFVMLWAMAFSFHIDERQPPTVWHGLLFAVTALLVVGAGRPWTFLIFLLGSSLVAASDLPAAANHTILALLTNGAILASGVVPCVEASSEKSRKAPRLLAGGCRLPVLPSR